MTFAYAVTCTPVQMFAVTPEGVIPHPLQVKIEVQDQEVVDEASRVLLSPDDVDTLIRMLTLAKRTVMRDGRRQPGRPRA